VLVTIAYVLINTETGAELDVVRELKNIEGVQEAEPVYGAYDIVVRVTSESPQELKRIITWQIRKIDRIKEAFTNIIY
jgi:DNA-binding Lrp family transcriptional regulator